MMYRICLVVCLALTVGCGDRSGEDADPASTTGGTAGTDGVNGTDGTVGSTSTGTDGTDGTAQITTCQNTLTAPESGTCHVTPGDAALLLQGRVMTPEGLLENGQVLVDKGEMVCVGCDCASKAPTATVFSCPEGLITPGLINPHDHIGWTQTPPVDHGTERYNHRHEWREGKNGKTEIKTPKNSSNEWGKQYGELRMVMSGTTSMMGSGGKDGLARNLDSKNLLEGLICAVPDAPTFPLKDTKGDMIATGCSGYPGLPNEAKIAAEVGYVPHVAEGVTVHAQNEFLCLSGQVPGSVDAVMSTSAFIHGIGLSTADIAVMANDFAGLVWSPRSNVSLYGFTADVGAYDSLGVQIALGTDWVPSGSMNTLRELACADYLNRTHYSSYFSERALVDMATANAADLSGFGQKLGRLQEGRVADIAIFDASQNANYRAVLDAQPQDVVLVLRSGEALFGDTPLVDALAPADFCDEVDVCGRSKRACTKREIGITYNDLITSIKGSDTSYVSYPLFFCGGPPADEPTCVPSRPNEFTGQVTAEDSDGDGIADSVDNCPGVFNPPRPMDKGVQPNADGDALGDSCDPCPFDVDTATCLKPNVSDLDEDGIENALDNCPTIANPDQANGDGDSQGDACDECPDHPDTCPSTVYAIKKGEVKEGARVSLPPLVVTAVGAQGYFVQHPPDTEGYEGADYSGVFVFDNAGAPLVKIGDQVSIVANVGSFYGQTQLESPELTVSTTPFGALAPVLVANAADVATGGARAAALEGMLISIGAVTVTDNAPTTDEGNETGEFVVTGNLLIDDWFYKVDPWPAVGSTFEGITGVLRWNWNNSKVAPRGVEDIVAGPPSLKAMTPALVYIDEGATGSTKPPLMVQLTSPAKEATTVTIKSLSPGVAAPSVDQVVIMPGAASAEVTVSATSWSVTPVTFEASFDGDVKTAQVRVVGAAEVPQVVSLNPSALEAVTNSTQELTVTLSIPAGAAGQTVELSANPVGLVTVPADVVVAAGEFEATFAISVLETAGDVVITATSDGGVTQAQSQVSIVETPPLGLVLSEVFYDPSGADNEGEWIKLYNGTGAEIDLTGYALGWGGKDYTYGNAFLSGTIASGGCFLIGGPTSDPANGSPTYDQSFTFSPNIQNSGSVADGVALFDTTTITATTVPIDAVIYGTANSGGLLDETGAAGGVDVEKASSGSSMIRTANGWVTSSTPNAVPCGAPQ